MCLICIDIARDALSPLEAARNLAELAESLDEDHVAELASRIEAAAAFAGCLDEVLDLVAAVGD